MQRPAQVTASRTPAPVQAARVLLTAVAISHLVVPLVMGLKQNTLLAQIAIQQPDFGAAEVARSATIAVTSRATLLSMAFSVVSWSSSPS
ncbi:hypothetical protein [Amycolatopsis australiensis]|uniref:Uncharacterized protein n=1 Tax=Amycolatopsis australiensis TaxID=546364 RepID=A0A1K1T6S4_9PSEU|nr:hypothetical protein [Amycolatopsis australiensis]SFW92071.1 hypothetical protein SAMN04489730_8366 [Amycolatopsis australiensis]